MASTKSVRYFISRPGFNHPTIIGDSVVRYAAGTSGDVYSKEITFSDLMGNGNNIWGVCIKVDGLQNDSLTITAQFQYDELIGYINTLALESAKEADFSSFHRLDSNATVIDYLPFQKVRLLFDRTGSNDDLTYTLVFVSSAFSVVV